MDTDRKIPFQSQRFTSWHNGFLFTGWPAFGYDAASGKVVFALAMAVGTRRMENQKMAVRCRRSSPVGFSMAATLSECPGMVRPPLAVRSPPLMIPIVIASPSVEGRGNLSAFPPPKACPERSRRIRGARGVMNSDHRLLSAAAFVIWTSNVSPLYLYRISTLSLTISMNLQLSLLHLQSLVHSSTSISS